MATPLFENLVQMLDRSVAQFGPRELFGTKRGGRWVWTTYAELAKLVNDFRAGLASLGVGRGERVAIISDNRVEWAVAAYACYSLGAALVPMYQAQLAKEWDFIVKDCEASVLLAATPEILAACKEIQQGSPSVKHVIGLALPDDDPLSFRAVCAAGAAQPVAAIAPSPDDIAVFIYTSGTTGTPKGVLLTHDNIASNITAIHQIFQLSPSDRSLSFLPWAHSFGHTCELHWLVSAGASMALCESVDKILPNLAEVAPTMLISVPRIFNRIYDNVHKQMADKPAVVQRLFRGGIRAATRRRKGARLGLVEQLTLGLADRIVFSKIRAKLGGRMRFAVSGGAALSREIGEFIDALGIVVFEGYGLTETAPLVSTNFPGSQRIGSVGKPIPGVKVVIDKAAAGEPDQGEIVIYGPNVMKGYHHRDEETKAVIGEDHGFRTGDLGYLDDDGFLYITGRIKEQYKLENGKYVAPAPLEEKLKLSPYILNAMIYGDNRPHNVALLVPDTEALSRWAKASGLSFGSDGELLASPRVLSHLRDEVARCSESFKRFEKIERIALADEDFTLQNGMLTPSLKLKRRVAWQRYSARIEALYESGAEGDDTRPAADTP